MEREEIFEAVRESIQAKQSEKNKPVRVAVNGVEGSGKTTFAIALVEFLVRKGLAAIHISIDGYHHDKGHRYRKGRDSADGYYEEAYQEEAFVEHVLQASQEDPPCYVPAVHDLVTDEHLPIQHKDLDSNAILVVDGAYLLKPVYRNHWDLCIYLHVPFETAQERGVERDKDSLGGEEAAAQKYQSRYHTASQRYLRECQPINYADIVIDNSDFENPEFLLA